MENELEAALSTELGEAPTKAEKIARYNYLARLLQDGGEYSGFMGNYRVIYKLYMDWKASNFVVWPYPGGRLQQPVRITHDMDAIGYRKEFYKLRNDPDVIRKSDALLFDPKITGAQHG